MLQLNPYSPLKHIITYNKRRELSFVTSQEFSEPHVKTLVQSGLTLPVRALY